MNGPFVIRIWTPGRRKKAAMEALAHHNEDLCGDPCAVAHEVREAFGIKGGAK